IAILIPTIVDGRTGDVTPALLLAVVLMVAAIAITEVVHSVRETAAEAQRKAGEVAASEERMRTMLEAAMVGLAIADADGKWTEVNDRLGTIPGRSRDE